jgi:hypothetical protein
LLLALVSMQGACIMVGYDVAADDMSEDGGVRSLWAPGEEDTSDAGSTLTGTGTGTGTRTSDGSVSTEVQGSDAGSTQTTVDKRNLCGLSSWLPGLIPDLSVIPDIPGITVECTNADAGVTTKADAGTRDAGATSDAGARDAAVDAATDGGRDASASDASASDASASDASADAAAYDASADAGDAGGS